MMSMTYFSGRRTAERDVENPPPRPSTTRSDDVSGSGSPPLSQALELNGDNLRQDIPKKKKRSAPPANPLDEEVAANSCCIADRLSRAWNNLCGPKPTCFSTCVIMFLVPAIAVVEVLIISGSTVWLIIGFTSDLYEENRRKSLRNGTLSTNETLNTSEMFTTENYNAFEIFNTDEITMGEFLKRFLFSYHGAIWVLMLISLSLFWYVIVTSNGKLCILIRNFYEKHLIDMNETSVDIHPRHPQRRRRKQERPRKKTGTGDAPKKKATSPSQPQAPMQFTEVVNMEPLAIVQQPQGISPSIGDTNKTGEDRACKWKKESDSEMRPEIVIELL